MSTFGYVSADWRFEAHQRRAHAARARDPDPQRLAVYDWQRAVLADFIREPLSVTASEYVNRVWTRYAPLFKPRFLDVPRVIIKFDGPVEGASSTYLHTIYCHIGLLYKHVLVHECVHLLVPDTLHGADFAAACVHVWRQEFGIDPGHARRLARRYGIRVSP